MFAGTKRICGSNRPTHTRVTCTRMHAGNVQLYARVHVTVEPRVHTVNGRGPNSLVSPRSTLSLSLLPLRCFFFADSVRHTFLSSSRTSSFLLRFPSSSHLLRGIKKVRSRTLRPTNCHVSLARKQKKLISPVACQKREVQRNRDRTTSVMSFAREFVYEHLGAA